MSTHRPLQLSDLIFSSASTDFSVSHTLAALNQNHLSITNRLHSIVYDSNFVLAVAEAYRLPLVANERCGSWFIPPERKTGSAYFKSTDGHHGQWAFSLRRLNLQMLDIFRQSGNRGCIIIDSTRRGKSMPDALSKTVPIWIAVMNRLLFPDATRSHQLLTPLDVVSRSEHAQIEERLPSFLDSVKYLDLDIEDLRSKLSSKPMRPIWMTPDDILPESHEAEDVDSKDNLVVLCTASGRTVSQNRTPTPYVQGAADDSESWALGLHAGAFWTHKYQLLTTAEGELPAVIDRLLRDDRSSASAPREIVWIKPTSWLCIADNSAAEAHHSDFDFVVSCADKPSDSLRDIFKDRYVHLSCTAGKTGSRKLRHELRKIDELIGHVADSSNASVLFVCHTGKDLAVGAALAFMCKTCTDDGKFAFASPFVALSKTVIKQRLSWIMVSMPDASPSRATLQSVNAYLMG